MPPVQRFSKHLIYLKQVMWNKSPPAKNPKSTSY